MTFIYKISTNDSPEININSFKFKELPYDLRSKLPVKLTKVNTISYGTNSLFFEGGLLWNNLPNNYKELESLKSFKKVCTCKICL